MPRIVTTCATTGQIVPTGHRTTDFALSDVVAPRNFRCPACTQVHAWDRDSASVEETLSLSTIRQAAA